MKISRVEVDIVDPFGNRFMCGYRARYDKQASLDGWYRKMAIRLKRYAKANDDKIGVREPRVRVRLQ